jgi:hypothetical protein
MLTYLNTFFFINPLPRYIDCLPSQTLATRPISVIALIQEHPIVLETLNTHKSKSETIFHTFELFPTFPQEIRLKIWKMSCLPQWVILRTAPDMPSLDLRSSAGLLLVNFEARQVFLENHTKYFDKWGQRGRFLNLERDTLCFDTRLVGLEEMVAEYPSVMNQVRFINIETQRSPPEVHWQSLRSLKLITLRRDLGAPTPWDREEFGLWHKWDLLGTLRGYKSSLLKTKAPGMPYEGPRLACIFPLSSVWDDELYLEIAQDLERASYGRLLGTSYNLPQNLQIEWVDINGLWADVLYNILNDAWWDPIF